MISKFRAGFFATKRNTIEARNVQQNVLSYQSITSDENVAFNYLYGLKIRNIINGYESSLITPETFVKTITVPDF